MIECNHVVSIKLNTLIFVLAYNLLKKYYLQVSKSYNNRQHRQYIQQIGRKRRYFMSRENTNLQSDYRLL